MSRKRRISKGSKRRLVILVPITLIVVAYFFVSISYYAYKIYSLKREENELNEHLNSLHTSEDELKINIEKLQNPEYLARYARENYHYSKDGELVIQRQEKESTEEVVEETSENNDSIIIACGVILFLIILYIMKKSKKNKR